VTTALVAPAARAEEPSSRASLKTSLVFIYGDDDVLHAPGDTVPVSPASGAGDRPGYDTLFEGYASRYTGRENWSELDLDGAAPGFVRGLTTRARLALALDASSLGVRSAPVVIEDVGSFVEAAWRFGRADAERSDALVLRVFPLNADRERIGRLEALAWGGAVGPNWESPYATASGPVRAARLELEAGWFRLYAALKTASFVEPVTTGPAVAETSYGAFGGVASRPAGPLGVALDVGHFEYGRLPGGVNAPRAATTGASLRVRAGIGLAEPEPPTGFGMERSPFDTSAPFAADPAAEPDQPNVPSQPNAPKQPNTASHDPHGVAVAVETAHLLERLWDFDHPGATALASARAVAVVAEARWSLVDVRALVTLRNPEFVLRDGSGAFPGQTLPGAAQQGSEVGAAVGVALTFARYLRPSVGVGVLRPAFVTTQAVDALGQPTGATLVLHAPNDVESLPPGAAPVPVFEVRPGFDARISRLLQALLWLQYRRDFNHTRLVAAEGGALARGFRAPDRLGYGVAARAVW
jgi:hypothetical protein